VAMRDAIALAEAQRRGVGMRGTLGAAENSRPVRVAPCDQLGQEPPQSVNADPKGLSRIIPPPRGVARRESDCDETQLRVQQRSRLRALDQRRCGEIT
jgi:hypothetical protein